MIPVLIVPTLLGRVDAMLASVDVEVGQTVIVANGPVDRSDVIQLPHNIGVAAAWNLGLKVTPGAEWWAIVNDDLAFAPGDLAGLEQAMAGSSARIATLDGFSAFGINREALERVGYFDENFVPAYCEDADYEYRCKLAHVPIYTLNAGLSHNRSATIKEERYRLGNDRTYPLNNAYFRQKWGGPLRGGETYETPFDQGGDPRTWPVDPVRRRELDWA